ncbi:hypothetical protein BACI349Y_210074 [Bacillus sp. 349Y]|nr:hypothetical protein BACI349Y_210074 [Bacillus sp. 349Y]
MQGSRNDKGWGIGSILFSAVTGFYFPTGKEQAIIKKRSRMVKEE